MKCRSWLVCFRIMFLATTEYSEFKTRGLGRKPIIYQNVTWNVDHDLLAPTRFYIIFSASTKCSELERRNLARKRIIEQNLTWNADLDCIVPNRFKIMFSATTEYSMFKTRFRSKRDHLGKSHMKCRSWLGSSESLQNHVFGFYRM